MIESAEKAREILKDRRYQHYLHEDCAYKGYLAADEQWRKRTEGLVKAAINIEDILEVPNNLGYSASLTLERAIKNFRDILSQFQEAAKKGDGQ